MENARSPRRRRSSTEAGRRSAYREGVSEVAVVLSSFRSLVVNTLVLLVLAAILFYLGGGVLRRPVLVEAIPTPKPLLDRGYSDQVTARWIADQLHLFVETSSYLYEFIPSSSELPPALRLLRPAPVPDVRQIDFLESTAVDFEIPGTGITAYALSGYLRRLLRGPDTVLVGEIVQLDGNVQFRGRLRHQPTSQFWTEWVDANNVAALIEQAARESFPRMFPDRAASFYNNQGVAKAEAGDLSGSLDDFLEALNYGLDHPVVHNNRGQVLGLLARFGEAIEAYEQGLRIEPSNLNALLNLGNALLDVGEITRAQQVLSEAVREHPEDPRSHLGMGAARLATTSYVEAEEDFTNALSHAKVDRDPSSEIQALLGLARLKTSSGDFDQATELTMQAVEQSRNIGYEYGALLGYVSLARQYHLLGKTEEARNFYESAISLARDLHDKRRQAEALAGLGLLSFSEGALEEAQEALEAALSLNRELGDQGREVQILSNLGNLYLERGKLDEAADILETAVRGLERQGEKYTLAVVTLNLGTVQAAAGEDAHAEASFRASVILARELEARHLLASALEQLGTLLSSTNRIAEAREALSEAFDLFESSGDRSGSARVEKALDTLRDS